MIDTTNVDLCVLIESHAPVRFTRVANTGGGEFAGSCPFCGDHQSAGTRLKSGTGIDRFRVWPYHSERPHYWCRDCNRSGDTIQFLIDYEHLTFKQALVELELEAEGFIEPKFRFYDDPPCKEWQAAAGDFIQRAERYLWHPKSLESVKALEYLRGRGFTDETIKGARLGYCPLTKEGKWFTAPLEAWGLTQEQTGKDVVRIADGIVIPWIAGDDIWKICIKRPWVEDPKTELVYGQVVGSGEGLYGAAPLQGKPVMLVEGEFDALSVYQETDLVTCVATGSASRGRTQRWISLLSQASLVLQSFDNDAAGDEGAKYWLEILNNAIRWKPWRKDPNEMLQRGQPIASWVECGIQSTHISETVSCPSESVVEASTQQDVPLPVLSRTCSEVWCKRPAEWYVEGGRALCDACHTRLGYRKWYHEPFSAI